MPQGSDMGGFYEPDLKNSAHLTLPGSQLHRHNQAGMCPGGFS